MTKHRSDFTYTATGDLGLQRSTMLENELHQRPKLARSITHCHETPREPHTYGVRSEKRGGVPESLVWPDSYESLLNRTNYVTAPKDFVSLNREAIRCGLFTSKELSDFRASHDIRQLSEAEKKALSASKTKSRRIPAEMVHGVSTRPSTPIHELLSGKFQEDWIQYHLKTKLDTESVSRRSKGAPMNNPCDTRASLLRTRLVPIHHSAKGNSAGDEKVGIAGVESLPPAQSLWKLERFNKVEPHLLPFSSELSRDIAFRHSRSFISSRRITAV